jgi:hypothetical protein
VRANRRWLRGTNRYWLFDFCSGQIASGSGGQIATGFCLFFKPPPFVELGNGSTVFVKGDQVRQPIVGWDAAQVGIGHAALGRDRPERACR